jgi:hypothetical protein
MVFCLYESRTEGLTHPEQTCALVSPFIIVLTTENSLLHNE